MADEEKKVAEEPKEEEKVKFKDLSLDEQLKIVNEKIESTNKRIKKLKSSLTKANKDIVNLENQKKAIMYDLEHKDK